MMQKIFMTALLVCFTLYGKAQDDSWKVSSERILSPWAEEVNPEKPLPEYPRPQMVRDGWQNLNGLWDYAIESKSAKEPSSYEGKILVPFAVESALSGVAKTVGKDSMLWYKTTFTVPKNMRKQNVILHFGAVDWETEVFVNGKSAGTHKGGYDPFSFDITPHLNKGNSQELVVRVWDPTDEGPQPRGKQVKNPEGIWYTPVTGIWQTVWLEGVPVTHIQHTKNTPDVDAKTFTVAADIAQPKSGDQLRVQLMNDGKQVAEQTAAADEAVTLQVDNPKLWTPDAPHLYDMKIAVLRNGKVIDEVASYGAMRKISMEPDENGIQRMMLNNEFVFQYGPLDQGWWPDGLYTAPTDEALLFDIQKTKDMGFNMIRKHVKVEPARWYHYCDSVGMLVWQDMPSGDLGNQWNPRPGVEGIGTERDRTKESEDIYRTEWKAIMDANYNFPSIVVWVPFNEAWGQFKTKEITEWTMEHDATRLVNSASGGNFYPVGEIMDLHNYPDPAMPSPALFGKDRVVVLGEFGGLGLPVDGHTWQQKDNWGYQSFKNKEELLKRYTKLMEDLTPLILQGLSAAVYTQTTDVEVEVNGLMTYDRKVIKVAPEKLKPLHTKLYDVQIEAGK